MLRQLSIATKVLCLRLGWPILAGLSAFTVSVGIAYLTHVVGHALVDLRQSNLTSEKRRIDTERRSHVTTQSVDQNGVAFYAMLSNPGLIEPRLALIYQDGAKNTVIVRKASYESKWNKEGLFGQYTIVCPIEGTYSAIHRFIRQILSDAPNLSLDDIEFKRSAVTSSLVEAKLHLTLFINDQPAERVVTAQAVEPMLQAASLSDGNVTLNVPPLPEGMR